MAKRFIKEGRIFEIEEVKAGIRLAYLGEEGGFSQGWIWICDDEAEAMDMVDAIIDPGRYADDEYRARHRAEFLANCKW